MIIACDVDDTVCELVAEWVRRYNADYNDCLEESSIDDWNIAKFTVARCGAKMYDYLDYPSLYDNVLPTENAIWGVNKLREMGHRVIFVTSATNGSAGRKLRWLQDWEFLPKNRIEKDYIECSDKSLIKADVMIDDGPHNLLAFSGKRIKYLRPWNKDVFVPGAWLACGWNEIPEMIKEIEDENNH